MELISKNWISNQSIKQKNLSFLDVTPNTTHNFNQRKLLKLDLSAEINLNDTDNTINDDNMKIVVEPERKRENEPAFYTNQRKANKDRLTNNSLIIK